MCIILGIWVCVRIGIPYTLGHSMGGVLIKFDQMDYMAMHKKDQKDQRYRGERVKDQISYLILVPLLMYNWGGILTDLS